LVRGKSTLVKILTGIYQADEARSPSPAHLLSAQARADAWAPHCAIHQETVMFDE